MPSNSLKQSYGCDVKYLTFTNVPYTSLGRADRGQAQLTSYQEHFAPNLRMPFLMFQADMMPVNKHEIADRTLKEEHPLLDGLAHHAQRHKRTTKDSHTI